jgi:hypothetical protein
LLELSERFNIPLRLLRTADRVNASLLPPADEAPLHLVPLATPPDDEPFEEQAA